LLFGEFFKEKNNKCVPKSKQKKRKNPEQFEKKKEKKSEKTSSTKEKARSRSCNFFFFFFLSWRRRGVMEEIEKMKNTGKMRERGRK